MQLMREKILAEGRILPGGILKVGSFLNQQIDTAFLKSVGYEIARLYNDAGITRILTIESSGISIACAAGMEMGVPVVFAKKHRTGNVDGPTYSTTVRSFTHGCDYNVVVSADYLKRGDKILLVDDFLANGRALAGLIDICSQAGASVEGIAVAIEKCFQGGGDELRRQGYRVESLAMIEKMSDDGIEFRS